MPVSVKAFFGIIICNSYNYKIFFFFKDKTNFQEYL